MSTAREKKLEELRAQVPEVDAELAFVLQQQGAILVDVREPDEVEQGSPVGAERIVRGFLELHIEDRVPDLGRTLVLVCAAGSRSLFASRNLLDLGYSDVRSLRGGFNAWKAAGLPLELPASLSAEERARYSRHLLVPEVGEAGQLKLLASRVLIVGAGGLGSPAAFYLAAAGIGTLGLLDDDVVDRSNLQRQILHTDARVGQPKVESARDTLAALNPGIVVRTHGLRLRSHNALDIFRQYDVIVDGSDNFATRYLVNDACVKLGLPNVHGSIFRFEGQASVFWPARGGPCYRCLFPEPPPAGMAPSCAEAGVLGVLPGVIGTLQAVETIKLLLGIGTPLIGRLLVYDALAQRFIDLTLERHAACPVCGSDAAEIELADAAEVCAPLG